MIWKDIPGYARPYRINEHGTVQQGKNGKWVDLKPRIEASRCEVRLRDTRGQYQHVGLFQLLDRVFNDSYASKNGLCACPRNGVKSECTLENMAYMSQSDVARRCLGKARRKPVVRYDRHGESVIYKTVSEAAEKNGMTRSSMLRRMRGEVLDPRGYKFELLR